MDEKINALIAMHAAKFSYPLDQRDLLELESAILSGIKLGMLDSKATFDKVFGKSPSVPNDLDAAANQAAASR